MKDALITDVCSILQHCRISQIQNSEEKEDSKRRPTKSHSKRQAKPDVPEYFIRSSYDPVTGLYYPMNWKEFHADKTTTQQTDRVGLWNIAVAASRRRVGESDSESSTETSEDETALEAITEESDTAADESASEEETSVVEPPPSDEESGPSRKDGKTASKKRKRMTDASTVTPSKRRRKITQPTPHSKAAMRVRKKYKIRPPSILTQDDNSTLLNLKDDSYLRAMYTLHVGERPDTLPCRDEEYVNIFENVLGLLQEASGGCICGSPFVRVPIAPDREDHRHIRRTRDRKDSHHPYYHT